MEKQNLLRLRSNLIEKKTKLFEMNEKMRIKYRTENRHR